MRIEEWKAVEAKKRQGARTDLASNIVEKLPQSPKASADAKKRSEANLKQNNPAPESAKLHARSDQQAASMVDVSARTVADAKKVMDNAPTCVQLCTQVKPSIVPRMTRRAWLTCPHEP